MEFFKKHADTIAIITAIVGALSWQTSQFNFLQKDIFKVEKDIAVMKAEMGKEIAIMKAEMGKEIAIIKTVLLMKGVLPNDPEEWHNCKELAKNDIENPELK